MIEYLNCKYKNFLVDRFDNITVLILLSDIIDFGFSERDLLIN